MKCPKCGSEHIQAVNMQKITGGTRVTTDTKTKGYGFCKGCLMSLILGPIGWLCGLCGMGKSKTTTTVENNTQVHHEIQYCCLDCGNQFKAEEALNNGNSTDIQKY